ncbi:strychnine-11-hydroxylase-like [Primulina tabacum]|uniref:strychnine-11-hydroxylase-like n=1 Tax=Primulina tabacum TaxID=48773 RepID=UPI003F5AC286
MSSEIFLLLFISFITILLLLKLTKKKRKLPLGPKKLPIIGNLHQLGKLPHRALIKLSKTYGDLMFLQLGSVPTLVVSSADMAREIFKKHDIIFSGRPVLYSLKRITYNLGTISVAPYGDYWREAKKIAVLELLSNKRVQSFAKVRDEEMTFMIDRVANSENPVDLSVLTFALSNNTVRRVAFGETSSAEEHEDFDERSGKYQHVFHDTQQLAAEFNVADYFPWLAWLNKFNGVDRRLKKNMDEVDIFLSKKMEEHRDPKRAQQDHEDIVDVLLRVQKEMEKEFTLTDVNLKGLLLGIFMAGTDSSSVTIVWAMAELMRNPEVLKKAQEEVRKVCKGQSKVEESDLPKLAYVRMVIKEAWRLHPPAPLWIPRETLEDCVIDNKYEIPAKTRVLFNAAAIGMDPKHWEKPERFWPERFLNNVIDFRGQHFELLPFGAGRRGCPGASFAIAVVELALANLLFRFDWELPKGMSPEDIDMEEATGVAMRKKIPLCLVATPVNLL